MRNVVRLTASATSALPRWLLLAICIVYASFGLFGRDPWKNEDAAGFGVMWTMANGHVKDWFAAQPGRQGAHRRRPLRLLDRCRVHPRAEPVGRCQQCLARGHRPAVLSCLRVCLVHGLSAWPARRSTAVQVRVRRRAGTARLWPHARRRRPADPARLLRSRRTRSRNHVAARPVRRHRHAAVRPCAQLRQTRPGRADLGRGDRLRGVVEQSGAGAGAAALYASHDGDRARSAAVPFARGRLARGDRDDRCMGVVCPALLSRRWRMVAAAMVAWEF